ncbi:hypothetical protein MUK42_00696 [Musa troglodytarum]|uniref:Membrane-associated kinase regulator 2 n=1 Tax=Musa troglodytarum TaxID=320322 RepID=A0A9E7FCF4_9LILI|nr:hypothetical protein MUK42_00696 [Musa troglodytarum]
MDSFSLLKYWRGGGGDGRTTIADAIRFSTDTPDTVATAVLRPSSVTTDDDGDDDGGPFFDLEFTTLPIDDGEVEEGEFNFELCSVGSGNARARGGEGDGSVTESLSPPDDYFFKGKLAPLEPTSIVITACEPDNKSQFPTVSLLKSATKLRIFLLRLRKPKSTAAGVANASPKQQPQGERQSRFFVKFKVAEVPIISHFTRDNSSRNTSSGDRAAMPQAEDSPAATTEEKRFAREVVQKYLNIIKPFYVKVSRWHVERLRLPSELAPAKAPPQEARGFPAGLRVVGKRLGKSRSASAAVAAVRSLPPQRRDDSLREQQDGIQSAIAHCKRSFTTSDQGT